MSAFEDDIPPPPPPPPTDDLVPVNTPPPPQFSDDEEDSDQDEFNGEQQQPASQSQHQHAARMPAAQVAPASSSDSDPSRQSGPSVSGPRKPPPPVESIARMSSSTAGLTADQAAKRTSALNPRQSYEQRNDLPPVRKLIMEGQLAKKSPKAALFTVWQDRYFLLYSDKLEYFKTRDDARYAAAHNPPRQPQGIIPLGAVKFVLSQAAAKGKPNRFDVVIGDGGGNVGRTFELQAASPYEATGWVEAIQAAVKELTTNPAAANAAAAALATGLSQADNVNPNQSAQDQKKFWKRTAKIEEILTSTPLTPSSSSGAGAASSPTPTSAKTAASPSSQKDANFDDTMDRARLAAMQAQAATANSKSPSAAGDSAFKRVSAFFTGGTSNSNLLNGRASTFGAFGASSEPAELSELPIGLQLVRLLSKSAAEGSVYLVRNKDSSKSTAVARDQFLLLHVFRKPPGGATTAATAENPESVKAALLFGNMARLFHASLPSLLFWGRSHDSIFALYSPALRVSDSLLSLLSAQRRLPEDTVAFIAAQLVNLLGYLHSPAGNNSTARSLSTENLYIDRQGRVVYLDLNLCSENGPAPEERAPEYLTPEFATGGSENRASDWWRLGVLLYELSVGIPPFRSTVPAPAGNTASELAETRRQKATEIAEKLKGYNQATDLRFPPFLSAGLQALIKSLLASNPKERLGGGAGEAGDAAEVRAHPYWASSPVASSSATGAPDWDSISLGSFPAPSWLSSRLAAPSASQSQEALKATYGSAVDRNMELKEHLLAHPAPENSAYAKAMATCGGSGAKRVLLARVLGARNLSSIPAIATDGIALSLRIPALGEQRDTRLPASLCGGSNITLSPSEAGTSYVFDDASAGGSAELTITISSGAAAAHAAAVGTPKKGSAAPPPAKESSVSIPLSSVASVSRIAHLPARIKSVSDLNAMELEQLVASSLDSSSEQQPAPQWYSLLSSESGMTSGELHVALVVVDLLIAPRRPAAQPTVRLQRNFTTVFGVCEGMESDFMGAPSKRASTFVPVSGDESAPPPPPPPAADDTPEFKPVFLGKKEHISASSVATAAAGGDDEQDDDDEDDEEPETPAAAASPEKKKGGNLLRGLVSKKKLRYQQDGFDLDLSYITPRIIAMGFPSEGAEAVYRNPMDQVQKFFNLKHRNAYRVYNLCSERKYDHTKFDDRVCEIEFNDHNAPAFPLMMKFCSDAHRFLAADSENVIAVHCKAGKGRTGTIIACFLLFENFCRTAEEALDYFGVKRTSNGKGVTIPSQRRYVHYFAEFLQQYRTSSGGISGNTPDAPSVNHRLRLKHIRFHTVPNFDVGGGCDPFFVVKGPPPAEKTLYDYRKELKAKGLKVQGCHEKGRTHVDLMIPDGDARDAALHIGCVLAGDVKFCFRDQDKLSGDDPMFHVWLNTNFIRAETGYHIVLTKNECDKAVKDKKCEKFDAAFKIEFWFTPIAESVVSSTGEANGAFLPVGLGRSTPPPAYPGEQGGPDSEDDEEEEEEEEEKPKEKKKSGNLLRGLVSKKKLRYQRDGFDLDLSYITPRIIAMGFPSEGAEAVYRNPMDQVQKFFSYNHKGRFRIYNLCSERHYDHAKFQGEVRDIPFNDHNGER
jgi:phosphatidylinositol-3,4,5-trisphosphate 3-phosphatase/dual-specificity protein phosphatase PTEN